MKKHKTSSNWADLPSDLTVSIFHRLGAVEILINAQKVCKSWHSICKDPSMWRTIDMRKYQIYKRNYNFNRMCQHAVDRSKGGLVDIDISSVVFCYDSLLTYIADRSSNLRRLALEMIYPFTNDGLISAVSKLPLLEELELSHWSNLDLKGVVQSCPKLKKLKIDNSTYVPFWIKPDDDDESITQLCHLQCLGNELTKTGVKAIYDNCPHVEKPSLEKMKRPYDADLQDELEGEYEFDYNDFVGDAEDELEGGYEFEINDFGGDSGDDYDEDEYNVLFTRS